MFCYLIGCSYETGAALPALRLPDVPRQASVPVTGYGWGAIRPVVGLNLGRIWSI
jgi:hypothetical protein